MSYLPTVSPPGPDCPKLNDICQALRNNKLQERCYDLFLHLGLDRQTLELCLENQPFDSRYAMVKMISMWLVKRDPSPTWKALVDVIENDLLEGKIARDIMKEFCPELLPEEGMHAS